MNIFNKMGARKNFTTCSANRTLLTKGSKLVQITRILVSAALTAGLLSGCSYIENHTSPDTYNSLTFGDAGAKEASKATLAYSQGNFIEAEEHVQMSLRQNPKNAQALIVGALTAEKVGRPNLARQYYEELMLSAGNQTTVLGTDDMLPQKMTDVAAKRLRLINMNQTKLVIEDANGTKIFSISEEAAARQGKSALEEALFIREQKNAAENLAVTEANVKAVEVLFTPQEQNIVSRFLIMKELAENDLITKEEFLKARQSNIGGLLPLINPPAGITTDKPVPSPDVIIERINALKTATEDRAITPREFSAERNLIVEAILPPNPRQRLKPQAPAKNILDAAKNIRKLEVIYDLGLITAKEKEKEQAAIERHLGLGNSAKAAAPVTTTTTTKTERIEIIPAEALKPIASTPVSTAPQMPEIIPAAQPTTEPQPLLPNVSSPFNG